MKIEVIKVLQWKKLPVGLRANNRQLAASIDISNRRITCSSPGCRDSSEQILNAEVERVVLGGPRFGVRALSRRDVQRLETPWKTVPVSDAAPHSKLVENTVVKLHERFAVRGQVNCAHGSGPGTVQRIGDVESIAQLPR